MARGVWKPQPGSLLPCRAEPPSPANHGRAASMAIPTKRCCLFFPIQKFY